MKLSVRILFVAALVGAFSVAAAPAQSTPDQQQAAPTQPSQDQNSGVSHPPPDSTIQADEDLNPPPPPAQPIAKPSAAIPAAPSNAPLPINRTPVPASVASAIVKDSVISRGPDFSSEVDNTDSGIVTVVPGPNTAQPLQERASAPDTDRSPAPDNDIVSYVPVNPNDLSPGTNISVRLSQPLSTADTNPGTPFRATIAHDVYNGSRLVIPAGAEMRGRVTYVSQGHHFGMHASLRLRPESIQLPDGTAYRIYADVVHSSAPGTKATDEGAIRATNHYGKDGVEYGGSMGTGAVVGGVVGGPVGAGVGTLVGASVVTAHLLLQNPSAAQLPQGTELVFSLTQPIALTPVRN